MMAIAIGSYIGSPPNQSGSIPPIVVQVLKRMGCSRRWADTTTARSGPRPPCFLSTLILSSRTMALLMTIPDREMTPRNVMKSK